MPCLKLFHSMDRTLYIILVHDLWRSPSESLQVMGLWLWLERGGICHFVKKILALPPFLINELADEGVICINCINNQVPASPEAAEIPLTHSLVGKDISLQFFVEHQFTASREIQKLVNEPPRASNNSLIQSFSGLNTDGGRSRANETAWYDRTMFVTFSKGYPVSENECIESFHMQEVRPDEQALYAKIVFMNPSFIEIILRGVNKAKFSINGKHVWMRKFVPKNEINNL
ncbi:hypothetical protein ACJIZ3_018839 [Penstemon smallii]|uniref:Uncharacterized protein n=1 Tax=Penstemon smallii TaxID=265156 RepID=A0ABD3SZJ6_9LAMI